MLALAGHAGITGKQGEWIDENIPKAWGNPTDQLNQNDRLVRPTLIEAGIDYHDSPKFRLLSKIPDGRFEDYIERVKEAGEEITTRDICRLYGKNITTRWTRRTGRHRRGHEILNP